MDTGHHSYRRWLARCSLGFALVAPALGSAAVAAGPGDQVFATVDKQVITLGEFSQALLEGVRRKYYHGKIPEPEQAAFQREVADRLIDRTLLLREALRRDLKPDRQWVERRLAGLEQRAQKHPQWATHGEQMLAQARERLEQNSIVTLLEKQVRGVGEPTEAQLRAFYKDNPELFTEPERFRISAILLRVEPSAASPVWAAAQAEAAQLLKKLRAGASFAELARLHSADGSASKGGDMGYLHRGMLGVPAQEAVDAAKVGDITDPVTLLEGVAIFRLDDRPPARLRAFDEVRARAAGLWARRSSGQAWERFVAGLRAAADIQVYDKHLLRPTSDDSTRQ